MYTTAYHPTHKAAEVLEVFDEIPKVKPHDTLKTAVIKRTTKPEEVRTHQLLVGVELNDRSTSQLLSYMYSLIGDTSVDEIILRQLWLRASLFKLPLFLPRTLLSHTERAGWDS